MLAFLDNARGDFKWPPTERLGPTFHGGCRWQRDRSGALFDQLFDHCKDRLPGFDRVFAKPDTAVPQSAYDAFQEALRSVTPLLECDWLPAEILHDRPILSGCYVADSDAAFGAIQMSGPLSAALPLSATFGGHNVHSAFRKGYRKDLSMLRRTAAGRGYSNTLSDEDGIIRRLPMPAVHHTGACELHVAEDDSSRPGIARSEPGVQWLVRGQLPIPVDETNPALMP